jgi:hypothetical protein
MLPFSAKVGMLIRRPMFNRRLGPGTCKPVHKSFTAHKMTLK